MLINAKWYKDEIRPNTLYRINRKKTISHFEPQDDDEGDYINIAYDINEKEEYGIFCHEYRPGFIAASGCKKTDLLMLVINDTKKKLSTWIFDVKKTVGGKECILNLLEQLNTAYKHKSSIVAYFPEYEEVEHVGFITRDYQLERIENYVKETEQEICKEEKILERLPASSNSMKMKRQLNESKMEIEILKAFVFGYIDIQKKKIPLEIYMSKNIEGKNVCDMVAYC